MVHTLTHTLFIYTYIHNLPDVPHISWQDHIPDMLRSHVTFRLEPMTASDVIMAKIKGVLNRRCCGKATVALLRKFRTKQVSEFGSVAMGWMGHTYHQGNIYIYRYIYIHNITLHYITLIALH